MSRHVLVLNRFDAELGCRYDRYLNHGLDRVAYLTNPVGRAAVRDRLAERVVTVADLGDVRAVEAHARLIAAEFGPFDHIIALYERELEVAAVLRQRLGVPGPGPDDVRRVRDKVTMKALVAEAGLRVPRFRVADSPAAVREFAAAVGFPVVLKPRDGADSQGIVLARTPDALTAALAAAPLDNHACEEFIDGTMFQVDGAAQDGTVCALRSSRLLNSCLEFALGGPFGSVANDDLELERRLVGYTEKVLAALGIRTGVFHLELFQTGARAGEYDDLVFLELGARVGGAEIPHLWRDVYGQDLHEIAVRQSLGEAPPIRPIDAGGEAAGYLLMPEPPERPCRVVRVESLLDQIPEMYAEILPRPGAILDGTGGCKETGGRYRFRAPSSRAIERAITEVVDRYKLVWEALPAQASGVARPIGRAQSMVAGP